MAPVHILEKGKGLKLTYVNTRGQAVLTPDELNGIKVCSANPPPEFHKGLVRLLVANDGSNCGDASGDSFAEYQGARCRYLDRIAKTVLSSAGWQAENN